MLNLRTRFALAVPSYLWIILAIGLGIIGGIIAYFVLRRHNKKIAELSLIVGMISTVFSVFVLPYLEGKPLPSF